MHFVCVPLELRSMLVVCSWLWDHVYGCLCIALLVVAVASSNFGFDGLIGVGGTFEWVFV